MRSSYRDASLKGGEGSLQIEERFGNVEKVTIADEWFVHLIRGAKV